MRTRISIECGPMPSQRMDKLKTDAQAFAMDLPGAWLDHPWGEDVVKVGKKIFVFFGVPQPGRFLLGVKLVHSASVVLAEPWAEPSGYGLGKAGRVTVQITRAADLPPFEVV